MGLLLLFYGVIDIVSRFSTRDMDNLWWMQLIAGIIMVAIGFWAISPDSATVSSYRGVVLLVVWIGAAALIPGIGRCRRVPTHSANKRLESLPRPDRRSCQAAVKPPSTG